MLFLAECIRIFTTWQAIPFKKAILFSMFLPAISTPYPLLALNCLPFCLLYYLLLQVGYPLLLSTAKLLLVSFPRHFFGVIRQKYCVMSMI